MSWRGQSFRPAGFDTLFEPRYVRYANADTTGTTTWPVAALVHRIHVICQPEPGRITVCESAEGWRFLPGGRLEPGETVEDAAKRELLEEAGVQPTTAVNLFFSHVATSRNETPYLPHAPHPVMWWTYGICAVSPVGSPTAPRHTEQITAVLHLPVLEAAAWLADDPTDPAHGEVVRLAAHLGLLEPE